MAFIEIWYMCFLWGPCMNNSCDFTLIPQSMLFLCTMVNILYNELIEPSIHITKQIRLQHYKTKLSVSYWRPTLGWPWLPTVLNFDLRNHSRDTGTVNGWWVVWSLVVFEKQLSSRSLLCLLVLEWMVVSSNRYRNEIRVNITRAGYK